MSIADTSLPGADPVLLFAITAMQHRSPDGGQLNAESRARSLARAARGPARPSPSASRSPPDLPMQSRPEPRIKVLLERIDTAVQDLVLRTVDSPGDDLLENRDKVVWPGIAWFLHHRSFHRAAPDDKLRSGTDLGSSVIDGMPLEAVGGLAKLDEPSGVPVALGRHGRPLVRKLARRPDDPVFRTAPASGRALSRARDPRQRGVRPGAPGPHGAGLRCRSLQHGRRCPTGHS
jgi:hypothetical protein